MLTVANYHYIRENFNTKYPSIFGVTPQLFKNQLLLLKDKGDFVHPNDLILNYNEILGSKDNFFLITYDDGLKEQYKYALTILEELNIPSIFFANSRNYEDKKVSTVHKIHLLRSILSPSDFLKKINTTNVINSLSDKDIENAKKVYIYDDNQTALLKYLLNFKIDFKIQEVIIKKIFDDFFDEKTIIEKLYMNENEIIQLSKKGYLGSHTHNHFPIGLLDKKEIKFELSNSKMYFENLTNSKIEMVAYPYGSPEACTIEVAEIAKEIGYKFGFTTTQAINTIENNYLLLNRFDCNDLLGGKNYSEL
jgi:peptidoglycan/xylan/chitin deacetylase (PgdA/CDA1 family)